MINNKSFVLTSIFLLQSLCIASVDETTFIDNICNMTPLPENCTSLLMSDPHGSQAPTLIDLTIIALNVSINGALSMYRKAADLARQYRGAPEQEPLSIYVDFITGLQEVVDNVRSSSFKNMYESVNVAAHQLVNCENEFASRGLDSLLIQDDVDLAQKVMLSANLACLMKNFLGD